MASVPGRPNRREGPRYDGQMSFGRQSSRTRYREYLREYTQRRKSGQEAAGGAADEVGRGGGRHRSFFELLRAFLGMLGDQKWRIAVALATLTIATLLSLAPPAATKIFVDYILLGHSPPPWLAGRLGEPPDRFALLGATALAIIVIAIVSIVIGTWGRWQATRTTRCLQVAVRRRVFDHAVRLPLHRVYALKSGGVTSILREDAGGVADLIFSMLYNPWRAIVQLVGTMCILAAVDWRLLLGAIVLIPVVWMTHRTWIARVRPIYRDIRATRQRVDTHATEAFGGMRVVRTFARQRTESARFTRNNHLMARQELFAWWWARSVEIAWAVLIPTASGALLYWGGRQVLANHLTAGDLLMFMTYLVMLLAPLATLAETATALQNGLAGLDRVLDLLDEDLEIARRPGAIVLDRRAVAGRIGVRDVSFRYPGSNAMVIEGVSLDAEPGRMVAFVGRSGAGKTTLCNLIARFYEPTQGVIELDGRDLREIDLDSYRRLLGIVEQDIFLFDGTVADNIGYGRRGAGRRAIERVAAAAHADEFIERLDHGYDTIVGERGVKLSGGQRQRLAIARAMLADPRILILDEATSSLDTESERFIQASLGTLMQGRTSFVIAHRLSTIVHADTIVLLDAGRILAAGTHDDLLEQSELYRSMVFMQVSGISRQPLASA